MLLLFIVVGGAASTGLILGVLGGRDRRARIRAERAQEQADEQGRVADANRRIIERIRRVGLRRAAQWLMQMPPWRDRLAEIEIRDRAAERIELETAADVDDRRAALDLSLLPTSRVVALTFATLWAIATILMWRLDSELLFAQHGSWATSVALGLVISMVVEMLGLIFYGVLGLHDFKALSGRSRNTRVAMGVGALTLLAALVVVGVVPLASARTENELGGELRSAKAVLAVAENGGTVAENETARLRLEAVQKRFDRGVATDRLWAGLLIVAVFVLSLAPAHATEVVQLSLSERRKKRAARERAAVQDDRDRLDSEFEMFLARVLDDGGLDALEVSAMPLGPPPQPDSAAEVPDPVNPPADETHAATADEGPADATPPPADDDQPTEPQRVPVGPDFDPFNLFPGAPS